jgi:cytochrome P450
VLRYDTSSGMLGRIATEDITLPSGVLTAGSLALAVPHAANRDPDVFTDPETFDIARGDNRHVGLGHGIHTCIGSALARLEAAVAVGEVVRRLPGLTVDTEDLPWNRSLAARGVTSLPASTVAVST